MVEPGSEQLSASFDEECTAAELELALKGLQDDPEYAARWRRYQLIGDTLKNQLPVRIDPQFGSRLSALIDAEPALALNPHAGVTAGAGTRGRRTFTAGIGMGSRPDVTRTVQRPWAAAGLTATLVIAAGTGLLAWQQAADDKGRVAAGGTTVNEVSPAADQLPQLVQSSASANPLTLQNGKPENQGQGQRELVQAANVDALQNARIGTFLLNHNESASLNRFHGVMPYMHTVSYAAER